jgi:hypothetical protein
MNVKEAVKLAKEHILDLFDEENLANLGLEEVTFNEREQEWVVTLGFSRPWDEPRNALASVAQGMTPHRSYKIVRISDAGNDVISINNYKIPSDAPF